MEAFLVVEVDGGQHALVEDWDMLRSGYLENHGFKVIRFWNNEVLENLEGVLEVILKTARKRTFKRTRNP